MTTRIVRIGNTLSVEIPEELVTQASLRVGEPVEWIANGDGTISLVPHDSPEHRHIRAGLAELAGGQAISNERVMEWLDSWGTETERPAPQ
jgi:antitoxin component of MazEF toxin-antitoxin module